MKRCLLIFFNITTRFFTGTALAYAAISLVDQTFAFSAIHLIKIFIVGCVLGAITGVRASLENKKWMLKLSFLQKRWIFFPFYLLTALLFVGFYGFETISFGVQEIAACSGLFLLTAGIFTAIAEKQYKKTKQNLTASITAYKDKIGEK